jgi:hypothetical protein
VVGDAGEAVMFPALNFLVVLLRFFVQEPLKPTLVTLKLLLGFFDGFFDAIIDDKWDC